MTRQELKELCERATPGPWRVAGEFRSLKIIADKCRGGVATVTQSWTETTHPDGSITQTGQSANELMNTANFIAAARTAIPKLIEDVERLRGALRDALQPKPDENPHDGPCCYRLMKAGDGKKRWLSTGCDCGNYDDAQSAGEWASDMNRWLEQSEARAALDATKE